MVATIFLPLNLLAGMMGMNVKVPGRDVDNLDWFLSIIGFMIALSLILLSLFKCVKWM